MQIAGKKAVVIGRSNIVGLPAALLLQRRDATVTIIHSRTPDARSICADADIVIAACGEYPSQRASAVWVLGRCWAPAGRFLSKCPAGAGHALGERRTGIGQVLCATLEGGCWPFLQNSCIVIMYGLWS